LRISSLWCLLFPPLPGSNSRPLTGDGRLMRWGMGDGHGRVFEGAGQLLG
jgi:hypothetical protein